jgi:hypothetical protein
MVATDVLLLLHVPPVIELESVVVEPAHKLVVPLIVLVLQPAHLYTWPLAGNGEIFSVNVVLEGTGDPPLFGSVCQSVALLAIPMVAAVVTYDDGP